MNHTSCQFRDKHTVGGIVFYKHAFLVHHNIDLICKYEPHREKTGFLPMRKQRRRSASAKLISAFVFATRIVQFLFYLNPKFHLNPKFQASSSFLSLYRPVCVGPGRKPRRPVFSRRGSYHVHKTDYIMKYW